MVDLPELAIYTHGEDQYFVANQVMKILGFTSINFARTLKRVAVVNKMSFADFPGEKVPDQRWTATLITRGGVRELIARAKNMSSEALELFRGLDFEVQVSPPTLEECLETKPRQLTRYIASEPIDGENVFFIGYEITTLLGYKHPIRTIHGSVDKENQLLFKDFQGEKVPSIPGRTVLVSRRGACQLLVRTRQLVTRDVEAIFNECGIERLNKKNLTKEQQTLSPIVEILKMYKPRFQYPVGKYRLDIYFPDYRIIVECDESSHAGYDPAKELEREEFVNHELGLSSDNWTRYNPDARDFCLKRTIRIIMAKIERIKESRVARVVEAPPAYVKRCYTCRQEKEASCFNRNKRSGDDLDDRCRECKASYRERFIQARRATVTVVPEEKYCPPVLDDTARGSILQECESAGSTEQYL